MCEPINTPESCDFCGADATWELPECLTHKDCDIDKPECVRHVNFACSLCAARLDD